ncbi:MAG TPA: hypothetical protein VK658_02555 [Chryseolinea sp.]|nr:hypothetical protein [Chryseolinea sp.]
MALKEYFPYCQVFHALSARTTKDHRFLEQKAALQQAAVYAADRAVLKQVMTDDALQVGKSFPPFMHYMPSDSNVSERFTDENDVIIANDAEPHIEPAEPLGTDAMETEQDLTRARQTDAGTLNFQHRAQQIQAEAAAVGEIQNDNPVAINELGTITETDIPVTTNIDAVAGAPVAAAGPELADIPSLPEPDRLSLVTVSNESIEMNVADQVISDLERLNQLKHNFEALFEANKASILLRDAAKTVGVTPVEDLGRIQQARQKRIAELVSSLDPELNGEVELDYVLGAKNIIDTKNILEEIKNNKQELEPESQKQKDQLQMIDDFIKTQPNLTGKDRAARVPEDLSTIKTGEFSDNIVSETLVDILIKQGKKDKAVEVLKKLIWKFPQKKAYFAAQIEDLKK